VSLSLLLSAACGDGGVEPIQPVGPRTTESPVPNVKAPRLGTGWLHNDRTRIVNAGGREVRFTGLGLQTLQGLGLGGHPFDAPTERDFDNIAAFGFNMIRLPIRWLFLEPTAPTRNGDGTLTHHWNQEYLRAMDTVIRGLGARDVKVLISMNAVPATGTVLGPGVEHVYTMPTWVYPQDPGFLGEARCDFIANVTQSGVPLPSIQEGVAEAWRLVAERYADDDTVIGADILNEPYISRAGCPNGAQNLRDALTRIGSAIQEANPRLVLVFEDGASPPAGQFFLPSPPPLDKLIYSFHVYAKTLDQAMAEFRSHQGRAETWNVPLYMGEFNGFGAATRAPSPNWEQDTRTFLDTLRRDGVGWSFWAYCCGGNSLFEGKGSALRPGLIPVLQSGFD
jgi:hypothetical protein